MKEKEKINNSKYDKKLIFIKKNLFSKKFLN